MCVSGLPDRSESSIHTPIGPTRVQRRNRGGLTEMVPEVVAIDCKVSGNFVNLFYEAVSLILARLTPIVSF